MAKFIVTLEVEFDAEKAVRDGAKLRAPRKWNLFQPGYLDRWRNYTRKVTIISITDPVLTDYEEQAMKPDWRLANHDLEPE